MMCAAVLVIFNHDALPFSSNDAPIVSNVDTQWFEDMLKKTLSCLMDSKVGAVTCGARLTLANGLVALGSNPKKLGLTAVGVDPFLVDWTVSKIAGCALTERR